jgi:hypothetical protein
MTPEAFLFDFLVILKNVFFYKKSKKHKSELAAQFLLENFIRGSTRIHIIHRNLPHFVDLRIAV